MERLKSPILFITRTYPPVIGGMETLSYNLTQTISHLTPTFLIRNPYGRKALPFFIPWATLKAIILIIFRKIKIVHLSDGVLAPIGVVIQFFFPQVRVVSNIHGLDLAYAEQLKLYHYTNLWAIRRLDKILAVSREVENICLEYGIDQQKIVVIPNGTDAKRYFDPAIKKQKIATWQKFFPQIAKKVKLNDSFILLSLGRIVKRKGLFWFVKEVMPYLPDKIILVIAGSGPDERKVREAVKYNKLDNRIFFLGFVNEEEKKILLNTTDALIMPNLKIKGDREGFGITAIEAGSCGLIPIVSELEGLKDAVQNEKNGLSLPSTDKQAFIETIKKLADNSDYCEKLSQKTRRFVSENFDWSIIGEKYMTEFRKLEK